MKRLFLLILVFIAVFTGTLAWSFPLSMALYILKPQKFGLAYSEAEGRVWEGHLRDAVFRGIALGDVAFRNSMTAGTFIQVQSQALRGDVKIRFSDVRNWSVSEAQIAGDVDAWMPLSGVQGLWRADISQLIFESGQCRKAEAQISVSGLSHPRLHAIPPLSGPLECKNGDLHWVGVNDDRTALLTLIVSANNTYKVIFEEQNLGEDQNSGQDQKLGQRIQFEGEL